MRIHVFESSSDVIEVFTRSNLADLDHLAGAGAQLGVPLTLDDLRSYLTELLTTQEPYSYANGHENLVRLRALAWLVLRRGDSRGELPFADFLDRVPIALADIRFSYEVDESDAGADPKDVAAEEDAPAAS